MPTHPPTLPSEPLRSQAHPAVAGEVPEHDEDPFGFTFRSEPGGM